MIKNLNLRLGNHVRISKYKNIFAKGYTPNFIVGYDDIEVDNIKDIHKYLKKKNKIV